MRLYGLCCPVLLSLVVCRPQLLQLAVDLDAIKLLVKLLGSKAAAANEHGSSSDPTTAADVLCGSRRSNGSALRRAPSTAAAKARAAAAVAAATAAATAAVQLRHGCLAALGALAMHGDAARQKMMAELGGRLVQLAVAALSDADAGVRAAAALCLRGLSRSVRLLRSGSIPAGAAGPLVALLQDSSASDLQVGVLLHATIVRTP